jgi:CubicO group peptidase (beta-lactamase class C family)
VSKRNGSVCSLVDGCDYQYEASVSMHPAYSFRMSTRDMARFDLLYQKQGMWRNSRIIPSEWIEKSTTTYSIVDAAAGVGYG